MGATCSFRQKVEAAMTAASAAADCFQVLEDQQWIYVNWQRHDMPTQGWKIHISATLTTAQTILERVLPVLVTSKNDFKIAATPLTLAALNRGDGGLSQAGKFITVYPKDEKSFVEAARLLEQATHGLRGPSILGDKRLNANCPVFYRYGGFTTRYIRTPQGLSFVAIVTPDGRLVPDPRIENKYAPEWIRDPLLDRKATGDNKSRLPLPARFIPLKRVHYTVRGGVYLALDTERGSTCIVKEARQDAAVSPDGQDARDYLRREYEILRTLADSAHFPHAYEFIQSESSSLLVMEDVQGEQLSQLVVSEANEGRLLPHAEVLRIALSVGEALKLLHSVGLVYQDMKASNVIVSGDKVVLLDLEMCVPKGLPTGTRGGTRGYMSPQHVACEPPSASDDVYGFGALLYFLLTAAEPSNAPDASNLLNRPIELLNPSASPNIAKCAERCLQHELRNRFATIEDVLLVLRTANASTSGGAPARYTVDPMSYAEVARQLGDAICSAAVPTKQGLTWLSAHPSAKKFPITDINSGSAGSLLALAELVLEFGDSRHAEVLANGAIHLVKMPNPDDIAVSGLYVGEAGVGAALLRAGQVLQDESLIEAARARAIALRDLPWPSPDLFNGAAGRARFYLLLYDETRDDGLLETAVRIADDLLDFSSTNERGERFWLTSPRGDAHPQPVLGYAHGAAGIADVLLDVFHTSGESRFAKAAMEVAQWLSRQAVPTLEDESGLAWPTTEGDGLSAPFWCHGATGIGRFFLNLSQLETNDDALQIAERAALSVARARWACPVQCHGLAGNIEFLIDTYQVGRNLHHLASAHTLAQIMNTFRITTQNGIAFSSESPTVVSPDYMVGYAGVAVCLLRLMNPEKRPHQLSRAGFIYSPVKN